MWECCSFDEKVGEYACESAVHLMRQWAKFPGSQIPNPKSFNFPNKCGSRTLVPVAVGHRNKDTGIWDPGSFNFSFKNGVRWWGGEFKDTGIQNPGYLPRYRDLRSRKPHFWYPKKKTIIFVNFFESYISYEKSSYFYNLVQLYII